MRLIDADALKDNMLGYAPPEMTWDRGDIEHKIDEQPTVEAEPEKGAWEIAVGYDPRRAFMCDQCHKMAFEPSFYCPNCGAKMDNWKELRELREKVEGYETD